jgi:hypothetical protein
MVSLEATKHARMITKKGCPNLFCVAADTVGPCGQATFKLQTAIIIMSIYIWDILCHLVYFLIKKLVNILQMHCILCAHSDQFLEAYSLL